MLSEELRNELAGIEPTSDCDRRAELSGLFHSAGSVHLLGRNEVSVHLDVASSAVARRAFSLLRACGIHSEIRTYRQRAFARPLRYQLHVAGDPPALAVLREAGVLSARLAPLEQPPKRVVAKQCCRSAYLRGALLGSGTLSGPHALHLEIRRPSLEGARFLATLAPLQVIERGRHAAAYAKGAEAIETVLAAAGAGDAVLRIEEQSVIGETRAHANRLTNADHANLVRASAAAHRQARAVRALAREGVLGDLPDDLREAAELRLRHPSLSLRDLARRCRPPVTKATLHRRLRRLEELADA